jgi:hypothetical protein
MTSAMQNGHNISNFDWEESLQVRFNGNEYNRFSKEFAESADRIGMVLNQWVIIHSNREVGMLIVTWEQTFSYMRESHSS